MSELDMSQYLDLFLQEGEEQLDILEQEVVRLESDPSMERLQLIFRAAHTLKGSSRAMGFVHFAEVTHEMENLLDLLRTNQLTVTTEVVDVLFKCLDVLNTIKGQIAAGEGENYDCTELVESLQLISSGGQTSPQSTSEQGIGSTAETDHSTDWLTPHLSSETVELLEIAQKQAPIYQANFVLSPDCVMKWVRAFMAINLISEAGEILLTFPDQQLLEDEHFETQFVLIFQTSEDTSELETKLRGIAEIERFRLEPFKLGSTQDVIDTPVSVVSESEQPTQQNQPPTATQSAQPSKKTETGQTVRVDVARLDDLMNLVGELVIDRTRVAQIGAELAARYDYDQSIEALGEVVGHISRITSDLQDQIMKARMLPIETVFNRFPRMMRDLAQKVGKEIHLEMEGGETELDRSVIEVIGDPLIHILRNSADHGIESPEDRVKAGKPAQGNVRISARHQENHIVIEIVDDGKGIDVDRIRKKAVTSGLLTSDAAERLSEKDALNLIFHSGLSTAEQVTDVSGRGVGMDIVRSNIQKLGGIIDLETVPGEGTKFNLRLPLTLAIIRGLLVKVSGVVYVLPLGSVIETLMLDEGVVQTVHKRDVIVLRGVTTPLIRLRDTFSTRQFVDVEGNTRHVVIVGLADQRIGFVVDSLIGEQEVVIKSLSRFCGDIRGISGATILGDGNVALILDINSIIKAEAA